MKSKQANNKKMFILYNNPFSNLGKLSDLSIDWSEDTPVLFLPMLCVPPIEEHILSSHISLSMGSMYSNNMSGSSNSDTITKLLNYSNNQLTNPIT